MRTWKKSPKQVNCQLRYISRNPKQKSYNFKNFKIKRNLFRDFFQRERNGNRDKWATEYSTAIWIIRKKKM